MQLRGLPGQYAYLFNMGGGKWLADATSTQSIQVGGIKEPSLYGLLTNYKPRASVEDYIGTSTSTNSITGDNYSGVLQYTGIFTLGEVWLINFSKNTRYQLDPALYQEFSNVSPCIRERHISVYSGLYKVTTTVVDSCPLGFGGFTDIDVDGWNSGSFYNQYGGFFSAGAYTGPIFKLSTECKDILVLRSNLRRDYVNTTTGVDGVDSEIEYSSRDTGGSTLYLEYKILKNIYVNSDGFVSCESTEYGIYNLPEANPTKNYSDISLPNRFGTGTFNRSSCFVYISLSRDTDDTPVIDLFSYSSYADGTLSTFTESGYTRYRTEGSYGARGVIVRDININPRIDYDEDLSGDSPSNFFTEAYLKSPVISSYGYFVRGLFHGKHITNLEPYLGTKTTYRMDASNFTYAEQIPNSLFTPSAFPANNTITSVDYIEGESIQFDDPLYNFAEAANPRVSLYNRAYYLANTSIINSVFSGFDGPALGALFSLPGGSISDIISESTYCLLAPRNDNPNIFGFISLQTSDDGSSVSNVRIARSEINFDDVVSTVSDLSYYLEADGQSFRISPSVDIKPSMYSI